jgi:6,7-dimethyl-8-ribityllumazine synthase
MNSIRSFEGDLLARGACFGIIVSRFNGFISERLLAGAIDILERHGVEAAKIEVARVPGAFEMPLAAKSMAISKRYDALVALGVVIRGETPHFEYVAGQCAAGLAQVSLQFDIALGFGVLTVDTLEQAIERAGSKGGNKGADAALAAIEMLNLQRQLRG